MIVVEKNTRKDMEDNDKIKALCDAFMNDETNCTSCEIRIMLLEAISELMTE